MKILIVEDDSYTRKLIFEYLKKDGMECFQSDSGDTALGEVINNTPDIIILDINLPWKSGLEICRIIREKPQIYSNPVIIMLTGETETEKVRDGFKTGAEDYIKKPFDIEELVLRVHAWTRRVNKAEKVIKYKEILLDTDNKSVYENDMPVNISVKEYEVLKHLIINKGLIVSREKIMESVWDMQYYTGCKTVDMTIKRIREKLKSIEPFLEAVTGIGYRLQK